MIAKFNIPFCRNFACAREQLPLQACKMLRRV